MYIIDESYFIKEIIIPNESEIDVSGSCVSFAIWIDQEVRLCLQNALGFTLFNDLDSQITDGVLNNGADQKWQDLVNGKTYTKNGKTYRWEGLKFTKGTFKGSLLAYYVYCKWLEFQLSQMTGFGENRGQAVNSMSANSTHRYVTIWNTFVKMYQGENSTDNTYKLTFINGVPFYDYFNNNESGYVSLVDYLLDNEDDYPDAAVMRYEYLNTFGL